MAGRLRILGDKYTNNMVLGLMHTERRWKGLDITFDNVFIPTFISRCNQRTYKSSQGNSHLGANLEHLKIKLSEYPSVDMTLDSLWCWIMRLPSLRSLCVVDPKDHIKDLNAVPFAVIPGTMQLHRRSITFMESVRALS